MIQGSIATRYATALYEEAKAQFVDNIIYDHLGMLLKNMEAEPELQAALINPRITEQKKFQLLITASGVNAGAWMNAGTAPHSESYQATLYTRFLRLILEHHREDKIRLISYVYRDLYRAEQHIDHVVFETAVPVDEATIAHLTDKIQSHTHHEVECECKVNPNLIGGFRLRIGDNRYDCSYRTKIEKIRTTLCQNR